MKSRPFRIAFVGLQPGLGWGSRAHLPALAGLTDDFEVVGVANSSADSSRRAASALNLPRAFESVDELVASPDVDVVAVTVKVPHHSELVSKALDHGKHVYCEWPLGNGLAEARELAAKAQSANVVAVIGTQALFAPEIRQLRTLVSQGTIGDVLSTSIVGAGGVWGATIPSASAYTLDRTNGANLLTIPVGHTLAALVHVLGPVADLSAVLTTRRSTIRSIDSDETFSATSPDQVLIAGTLQSGAPVSLHYRGGESRGPGLCWEIHGTSGDLRIFGDRGQTQLTQLSLEGGTGNAPYAKVATQEGEDAGHAGNPVVDNVRALYAAMARDLREGTRTAPTFDDAVRFQEILAAAEASAASGQRVRPADM